jgi:hypothetical protein
MNLSKSLTLTFLLKNITYLTAAPRLSGSANVDDTAPLNKYIAKINNFRTN